MPPFPSNVFRIGVQIKASLLTKEFETGAFCFAAVKVNLQRKRSAKWKNTLEGLEDKYLLLDRFKKTVRNSVYVLVHVTC